MRSLKKLSEWHGKKMRFQMTLEGAECHRRSDAGWQSVPGRVVGFQVCVTASLTVCTKWPHERTTHDFSLSRKSLPINQIRYASSKTSKHNVHVRDVYTKCVPRTVAKPWACWHHSCQTTTLDRHQCLTGQQTGESVHRCPEFYVADTWHKQ